MIRNTCMALVMVCAFAAVTGCKKDISATDETRFNTIAATGSTAARISPELLQKLTRFNASFRQRIPNGLQVVKRGVPVHHSELKALAQRAIASGTTGCDANTGISKWINQQLADWNQQVILFAINTAMLDIPTYNALFFEHSSANQVFGINGTYTQVMQKTFKDHKRFWNIDASNIALVSMSGRVLRDQERLKTIYRTLYGLTPALAEYLASTVAELAVSVPQFRNGDHPIFTCNAFALQGFSDPNLGTVPDKIAMGDGIMEAYLALGYGDVAPQAILGHEFGHHIQFRLGLFPATYTPEGTRRTELMADSYATYYLSHARGASMQWKRAQQFYDVFYNIGDCSFASTGHHGTPLQRLHASQWAYGLAESAQKQGHILTSQAFTALFEKQLPQLVQ